MATTFTGTFAGALSTDNSLVLGTCALGETFGQVKSASLKRGADVKEIKNCKGGVRAVLLLNPKTVLSLKTIFESGADVPQIGQTLTLPLISIQGLITDVTVDWTEEDERQFSIEATGWDALSGDVDVYAWDGTSFSEVFADA